MDRFKLGLQHCLEGIRLGLDQSSSRVSQIPATLHSSVARICEKSHIEGGCSRVPLDKETKQTVHGSEKGHHRTSGDTRPVCPEQVYLVHDIQNDDHLARTQHSAKPSLDVLNRPEGRLLACTNSSILPRLSGLQSGQHHLQIQGNAFWSQHCSQGVHQAGEHRGTIPETEGNSSSGLPRRLANLGKHSRKLPTEHLLSTVKSRLTGRYGGELRTDNTEDSIFRSVCLID